MSGNLYQLRTPAQPGQFVKVDGPYDRYGRVMALQASGYHLIRGIGGEKPPGPVLPIDERQ